MEKEDTCYVCMRITPEKVLQLAHKIWNKQPEKGREKGKEVSKIIEQCYKKKPWFFCGRSYRTILGGIFYFITESGTSSYGWEWKKEKTQQEIADKIGTNVASVRRSWLRWKKEFPELLGRKRKRGIRFRPEMLEWIKQGIKITTYRKTRRNGEYEVVKGSWYKPERLGLLVQCRTIRKITKEELIQYFYWTEGDFISQEGFTHWLDQNRRYLTIPERGWLIKVKYLGEVKDE